jgi:AraC-like DNA-binding protein
MNEMEKELMKEATDYLAQNIRNKITISQLASVLMISESNLKRVFRDAHAKGVYQYFKYKKIEYSKALLRSGAAVKQAGLETGYTYASNFIKAFKDLEGMTPSDWIHENIKDTEF